MENILLELDNNIRGIFISIDYERDTPQVLKTYHEHYSDRISFYGTKNEANLKELAKNFKLHYNKTHDKANGGIDHSSLIYIIGKDNQMLGYIGAEDPKTASNKIKNLIAN